MSKVPLNKSLLKQEMSLIRGSYCTLKVWVGNTVRRAFKIKFTIIDTVEVILAIIGGKFKTWYPNSKSCGIDGRYSVIRKMIQIIK